MTIRQILAAGASLGWFSLSAIGCAGGRPALTAALYESPAGAETHAGAATRYGLASLDADARALIAIGGSLPATSGASAHFAIPAHTPGGSPDASLDRAVVTVVRVTPPWYAIDALVARRMQASIPEYAAVQGLIYKHYVIADDGRIGGIYLWESADAARRFYDDDWHARINDRYGEPAQIDYYNLTDSVRG